MWTRSGDIAGKGMSWDDASQFVKQLNGKKYAGYSDWRLPTKEELLSFVNYINTGNPNHLVTDAGIYKISDDAYNGGHWSYDTHSGNASFAWYIEMNANRVGSSNKASSHYVWPVRNVR